MLRRFNLKKLTKQFSQFSDYVYLIILLEVQQSLLSSNLKTKYSEDEIKLLGGQVANWMFGRDLTTTYETFNPEMKLNYKKIESLIKPQAIQTFKSNEEYLALAVCYLRMRNTIFGTRYGNDYLNHADYNAGNEVLDMFGPEFKEKPTQNTFIIMVKDFFDKRPGALRQAEQIWRTSGKN